ncbi:rhamnogalacturonan acetylesterase [Croceicoccus mobilis]|uniref:Rhamnogalacturonan acetylesterase n=1 Tax=Croceicoccus mobilis TaxID=1703339 RepID=A0A916ZAE9_9SPHN|nr:rhamnogalacturonan acetylesterase [Croceicoccus mobilis]GGD82537.1 rhamnogalacturonan acetylesterase [Croceicoccus mobilis]
MPIFAAVTAMSIACSAPGAIHADLSEILPTALPAYGVNGQGIEPGGSDTGFAYSFAVPEGTWRVTVRLGSKSAAGDTTIKAESRRLMARSITTRAGQYRDVSFLVPVRTPALAPVPENAPGGHAVLVDTAEAETRDWDDRLTLEFLGRPAVAEICVEPAGEDVPTIYLAGDSTVADQPAEPAASWGQMLPALFDERIAVANHAKSGGTLKSFIAELRLAKITETLKPGDYLLIQFGHNDQKANWPQTHADARFAYPAYLRALIAEARARGAHPVLVTSPERRFFDDGRIRDTLAGYPDAMRKVAQAEGVPLVDLNRDSIAIYEALGEQRAALAFNDGGRDRTHHDNYGAWLMANAVAAGLVKAVPALAPHLTAAPFDPEHPPLPGTVAIAPSLLHNSARPQGY